jgi:excisionase family DNA binding protein
MSEEKKSQKRGFTIEESSQYTGIAKQTLYNAISLGKLKPRRWGRKPIFLREDLDRLLDSLPQ